MTVDRDEARRIASLARLRFEEDEIGRLTDELNGILEHVEVLRSLASGADGPAALPERERASTRPTEELGPDGMERGPETFAPRWEDGFFVVPPPPGVHRRPAIP